MWHALWVNANLATMAGGGQAYGAVHDGAIAVSDGVIAWLGPQRDLPGRPQELARVVHDARGAWITPGLIDCHTHLVHAGNRVREFELRLGGTSYEEIARCGGGILSTVAATRAASVEELVEEAGRRLLRLSSEGVTTVEVKSGYGLDTATELKMLGAARRLAETYPVSVRTSLLAAHALPPEYAHDRAAYVRLVSDVMIPEAVARDLADYVDAFCEPIAFTVEECEQVFRAAGEAGLAVRLHADQLSEGRGAELAARFHALSADHLEHASPEGVAAMATSGTVAVLLPGAYYFLGQSRKPPVDLLRRHGVPMAVATDCNPGTSPVTSLLLVMNMACRLFGLTPEEALSGVTCNAAAALGLDDRGQLTVGKRGDLALWDVGCPGELCYWMGFNPCSGVILRGCPVGR